MICRAAFLVLLLPGFAPAQCLTGKILPPVPTNYGFFGSYLDVEGDLAAVAHKSAGGERQAYLYERVGASWVPGPVLSTPSLPGGSFHVPLRLEGSTLFLGVFEQAGEAGRVHVFEESAGTWSPTQVLEPSTFSGEAHFGRRFAIDGDQAVIAAPMDATFEYRGGAVFHFEKVGGVWQETQRIDPPTPEGFGFFGLAVDIEGDTLVVGEPGLQTSGSSAGDLYVYERVLGSWVLVQEFDPEPHHRAFGYSLDLAGDRLVVSAFKETIPGYRVGTVHVLQRSSGGWEPIGRLASDLPDVDHFDVSSYGAQVEYEPPYLVVGSSAPELGLGSAVHVYREEGGWFELLGALGPLDVGATGPFFGPMFGAALALDGTDLWIGSPGDEVSGGPMATGAAYHAILAPVTTSYCDPALPNSTGQPAILTASGCGTLLEDDLVLEASQLPANQPVLFLASLTASSIPLFGGGQGTLCLGSPLGQYADQITFSGPLGMAELSVELDALPSPGGPLTAQPGESWHFQAWYRDLNPGPTSNLTNAIQLEVY